MKYKRISEKSQRAIRWKKAYDYSKDKKELSDCYQTYSTAKLRAYAFCVTEMEHEKGWGKRIIGHNCMQFTFAYQCEIEDGYVLRVITALNQYEIMWNPF